MKNNIKKWSFTASALVVGLPLLGGCAVPLVENAPTTQQTQSLQGRAFTLGTVTVAANAQPGQGKDESLHCLPDPMYAQMLAYDLRLTFERSGLTRGAGPAIPVNVTITNTSFQTNMGWASSRLQARVAFAGIEVTNGLNGNGSPIWENEGPYWTRQQRIIPAMATMITKGLRAVQAGRNYEANYGWESKTVGGWYGPDHHNDTYRLDYPMTRHDFEQATGKTAAQLAAVCKTDMK